MTLSLVVAMSPAAAAAGDDDGTAAKLLTP